MAIYNIPVKVLFEEISMRNATVGGGLLGGAVGLAAGHLQGRKQAKELDKNDPNYAAKRRHMIRKGSVKGMLKGGALGAGTGAAVKGINYGADKMLGVRK